MAPVCLYGPQGAPMGPKGALLNFRGPPLDHVGSQELPWALSWSRRVLTASMAIFSAHMGPYEAPWSLTGPFQGHHGPLQGPMGP